MLMRRKGSFLSSLGLLLTVALLSGCASKVVVTRLKTPGNGKPLKQDGVFYALPRTVIKIDIPILRENKKPGEFERFAHCFFPGQKAITKPDTTFTINAPKFSSRGEPDPDEVFMVKVKGGRFEDKSMMLELTEAGVMTKGEAQSEDHTLEFAGKAIRTIAGIAAHPGLGLFSASPDDRQKTLKDLEDDFLKSLTVEQRECYKKLLLPLPDQEEIDLLAEISRMEDQNQLSGTTEEARNRNNLAITAARQQIAARKAEVERRERTDAQFAKSQRERRKEIEDFKRAKITFDKILALQQSREGLIIGAGQIEPPSADALQLKLKELDKTIKDYTEKFLGSETQKEWVAGFEYTPARYDPRNPNQPSPVELFKLSKQRGVCEVPGDQGIQVPPDFFIKKVCPNPDIPCKPEEMIERPCNDTTSVYLSLTKVADEVSGRVSSVFHDNPEESGERGFYFRIPGTAVARLFVGPVTDRKNEKGRAMLQIAQLGKTVSLPPTTNGRKTKYTLALYEASGALKNFNLGSDALIDKSILDDVGAAANSLLDANDELKQLERQRKILEERKKIRETEEALKAPVSPPPQQ